MYFLLISASIVLMRNSKTKIKNVLDLVDRINILRSEIKEREEELKELTSVQFQEISPEPQGFDYKDSILAFFAENPSSNFKIGRASCRERV